MCCRTNPMSDRGVRTDAPSSCLVLYHIIMWAVLQNLLQAIIVLSVKMSCAGRDNTCNEVQYAR